MKRVGDKLLCKKSDGRFAIKGDTYIIKSVGRRETSKHYIVYLTNSEGDDCVYVLYTSDSINNNTNLSLSNYFYSSEEIRKMKLDTII